MPALKHLTKVFNAADDIEFDDDSKFVLMSDCHRGDGSWADNLANNENVYYSALRYYFDNGYTYIEIGDGDELWENKEFSVIREAHKNCFSLLQKFYNDKRLYMIFGNHDIVKRREAFARDQMRWYFDSNQKKKLPLLKNIHPHEALLLRHSEAGYLIFIVHGHQVDFLNSRLWRLARFLVRYCWRPLEAFGINNPTSPAKNNRKKSVVESLLSRWAQNEKCMLIAGHTHRPVFPNLGEPLYFNDGCCIHPHSTTAIEIAKGAITLVKWHIGTTQDGTLQVKKETLAGPEKLLTFYSAADPFAYRPL